MTAASQNTTSDDDIAPPNLTAVVHILSFAFLAVVMFGIGAAVTMQNVRDAIRARKTAFAVGMTCQYLVVPATARLVVTLLGLPSDDAFVVVMLGCCPGGSMSNAISYLARGDIALSIAMTAVTNLLAFGTLPLLLLLWTTGLTTGVDATIPFLDIFTSLLMTLLPAALGFTLRRHSEKWARRAEQLGAASRRVFSHGVFAPQARD
jgi:predicted Na+-dependent transporter